MKISEMTNNQAADALVRLSVPFENICNDEETLKLIDEFRTSGDDIPLTQMVGKFIPQIVANMLGTHRNDLYEIVGALTFRTLEDVSNMNFLETVKVIRDSYDEVMEGFFTSSRKPTISIVEKS